MWKKKVISVSIVARNSQEVSFHIVAFASNRRNNLNMISTSIGINDMYWFIVINIKSINHLRKEVHFMKKDTKPDKNIEKSSII